MFKRHMTCAAAIIAMLCGEALAGPTSQIITHSTDAKTYKEATLSIVNIVRFSSSADAGPNYYDVGILVGVNWYNPFYTTSAADYSAPGYPPIPGGKPTFTTQLQICLP